MPTWGNTNQTTTSYQASAANRFYGSLFTSPADIATVSDIIAYIGSGDAGDAGKGLIIKHSDLSLIATSPYFTTNGAAAARTGTFASPVNILQSTDYILGVVFSNASNRFYKETGSANQGHVEDNNYGTPTGLTSPTHSTTLFQVYCNYSASGGTTSVRKDSTEVFDIYNAVQVNITNLFDIINQVSATTQVKFDILATLKKDLTSIYDLFNSVTKDSTQVFDLFNKVETNLQVLYAMGGTVSIETLVIFSILSDAVKNYGLTRLGTSLRLD